MPILGLNLRSFVTNLGTFTEDQVKTTECAADAIVALAEAAQNIPNEGGWAAVILGDNSIADFGAKLPKLGTNLAEFVTNLGTFTDAQVSTVACASDAIVKMAEAADKIPNEGGWAAVILGDNSIATFGSKLPKLGTNLAGFVTNLGTFTDAQVTTVKCAANAIKALAEASTNIDGQADWAKKIFGDNGLSAFGEEMKGLGSSLAGFVKNLGTFTDAQVSTVQAAVKAVNAFANLADTDLKAAKSNLGGFGEKIVDLATDIKDFISKMPSSESVTKAISNLKALLDAINTVAKADADTATKFTNDLKKMATDAIDKFIKAFSDEKPDVKKAAKELVDEAVAGVKAKHDDMKKSGETLVSKFATAIADKKSTVKEKCKIMAGAGKDAIRDYYDSYSKAGQYLVDGFAAGISGRAWKAEAKAAAMAAAALEAAKEELDENSPSKEMFKIGAFAVDGFANALFKGVKTSYNAGSEMAGAARDGLNEAIGKVLNVLDTDMDMNPTIRPVLDLSGVNSGVDAIDGMFSSSRTIGVMTNLDAINAAMSGPRQNGNSDVVSAISKLAKQLGNTGGNVYNLNGITYNDDSNIAAAIETIVRAARVERRA